MGAVVARSDILAPEAIHTVLRVHHPMGVQGILCIDPDEGKIAILAVDHLCEVAIFAVDRENALMRHLPEKLIELLKERTCEIEVHAVSGRIPAIGCPIGMLVNGIGLVRRVHRKDVLTGRIAPSSVDLPLVPEVQPPSVPAIRALGRSRQRELHPRDDRRDGVQKSQVRICDRKLMSALPAGSRFDDILHFLVFKDSTSVDCTLLPCVMLSPEPIASLAVDDSAAIRREGGFEGISALSRFLIH